jgi:FkbM family methyltransferase
MANLTQKISRRMNKLKSKINTMVTQSKALPTLIWLDQQPYYKEGRATILGLDFEYVSGPALSSMYRELFFEKFNDFWCDKPNPTILDCGSNIGVSVLRFKQLFPQSKITAFEADPLVCQKLKRNIKTNKADNVEVVEAAVWTQKGTVNFSMDHDQSGRVEVNENEILEGNTSIEKTNSIRLADYLNEPIDFIKLDIEGAEFDILRDCSSKLKNVEKIIIETHYTIDRPDLLSELWMHLHNAGMKALSTVWQPPNSITNLSQPYEKISQTYDQWHIIYAWR